MQPQPMPQPGPMPPPGAPFGPGRGYAGLILVGILILLIGGMVSSASGFLDPSEYDEYNEYQDAVRVTTAIGAIIQYVGLILMSIGMLIGAIRDETLPQNVRLGILIAMGLIIGFKIWGTIIGV